MRDGRRTRAIALTREDPDDAAASRNLMRAARVVRTVSDAESENSEFGPQAVRLKYRDAAKFRIPELIKSIRSHTTQ